TVRSRWEQAPEEKHTPCFFFQVIHPDALSAGAFAQGRDQAANVRAVLDDILGHGNESCLLPGQIEAQAAKRSDAAGGLLFSAAEIRAFGEVAEEAGVVLAAHPDDPPTPTMRGQPRLVYQPSYYQKLIDLNPSPANKLEFCVGSLAEMTEGDIYEVVDHYSRQGRLGYVHLRNVVGKVPTYKESFIDDGDVDVLRVMRILHENGFEGVLIPDHAPQMSCAAPWHAGMAYALGFMQAGLKMLRAG
ncbi:MAG: mannonate dehydratase, partial [Opitutales bacterium]